MGIGAKRVDYHAAERKRILCTVSPVRSFHRGRERGALCWFRLHKGGLNPFKGTKSAHREARSKGNLPVKHGHWATPMDTTNQALEGIKGQNVGNVFGGLCIGKCTATGKRRGGWVVVVVGQQAPIISNRSRYCRGPEGVITLVSEPPPALRGNSPPLQRNVHSHGAPSIIPEPE